EGGVGTSIITGKSSVQHAREMESLAKAKGYSAPSLTQDQPEDASVGKKSSAKNEQPKREQYIAIGKFGVPQSLLTANAKKQQAKTGMLATKEEVARAEEGSAWDALEECGMLLVLLIQKDGKQQMKRSQKQLKLLLETHESMEPQQPQ
ncbi:hypothetical protein ADUPG1_000984, partial [Aduncisulcus paluster]